ncbi:MAG TPA: DUF4157 domain-containing protein, partial [Blastocatellia bacterium]|nr:DUF4157 domain-containing protein [Blastocatellia bacterium]
ASMAARSPGSGGYEFSRTPIFPSAAATIQTKLAISQPGDAFEQDADRVSQQVMNMSAPQVQRSCACGEKCPKCQTERPNQEQTHLQMKRIGTSDFRQTSAPPIVNEVLSSPGEALDPAARFFMEPRFGYDFSGVRVHTGERAARSADTLNAAAYTSGQHVVFGKGRYGLALLAHELAHVVQQSAGVDQGLVQRACVAADKCPKPEQVETGTAAEFGSSVSAEEAPGRKELKQKLQPTQPKSGSHGGRAEIVTKLAQTHVPDVLKVVHGIFVDERASKRIGARIVGCIAWAKQNLPENTPVPEFENATQRCVFVSKDYEAEAAEYDRGADPVGGRSREEWLIDMKTRLTHEATHERFLSAKFPFPEKPSLCSRGVLSGELSEMAAKISEFPHIASNRKIKANWFTHQATTHGENLPGTIRAIRCKCECPDADALIRAGFDLASASWSEDMKMDFHLQMKRGEGESHGIYWPYELPPRTGAVGRHEVSLLGGAGLTLSDKQAVALLSYRYVLGQWAAGRLRLTGGLQANLAGALSGAPREFGAGVVGVQFIPTPSATERVFGGLTGRIETGFGIGEFRLTPAGGGDPASVRRGDYILQVGAGFQFFIPTLTSLHPVTLEATYRLAQPIGTDAERIHVAGLQFGLLL